MIQRLETLKLIAAELKKINDPQKELVNVSAIIAAYEAGDLKGDGTTYWAQGKKSHGRDLREGKGVL